MQGAIEVGAQRAILVARFCAIGVNVVVLVMTEVLRCLALFVIAIVRRHRICGLEGQEHNKEQEQEASHRGKNCRELQVAVQPRECDRHVRQTRNLKMEIARMATVDINDVA